MNKMNKKLDFKQCPRCTAMKLDSFMNGICSDCNIQRNKIAYDREHYPELLPTTKSGDENN